MSRIVHKIWDFKSDRQRESAASMMPRSRFCRPPCRRLTSERCQAEVLADRANYSLAQTVKQVCKLSERIGDARRFHDHIESPFRSRPLGRTTNGNLSCERCKPIDCTPCNLNRTLKVQFVGQPHSTSYAANAIISINHVRVVDLKRDTLPSIHRTSPVQI